MEDFKKLGELIKLLREEKKLSQEDFAQKLEVTRSTVSLYESGSRKPTLERLSKIAEILETPLSKLLELDPPEKADLDIALRASGADAEDIKFIKKYIKLSTDAKRGTNSNS